MPKTGRNIYKRKDGRWEGRHIKKRDAGGKIIYGSVYGKSYAEVRQRLEKHGVSKTETKLCITAPGKQNITFAEVAEEWLAVISLKVKPTTYAVYAAALKSHILPAIGRRKMQGMTSLTVGRFAKHKLEHGRKDGNGGF